MDRFRNLCRFSRISKVKGKGKERNYMILCFYWTCNGSMLETLVMLDKYVVRHVMLPIVTLLFDM
jgi:hypothetical protein